MRRRTFITTLTTACLFLSASISIAQVSPPTFEASEHILMGDAVQLLIHKQTNLANKLHLPNGLDLSFGEILALGDLYQIPHEFIAQGDEKTRETKFLKAFNSFAGQGANVTEVNALVEALRWEKKTISTAIARGEKPEDVYVKITTETNRQENCITGGGCSRAWWLQPGRYLDLAREDYDHFGQDAWITYQTGHRLAINEARLAGETRDNARLEKAYAMEAFASHFLADRFSAGHIRTPRRQLQAYAIPDSAGALLAHFMHDEENEQGVHVHNLRGEHWVAYGDKYLLTERNANNMHVLVRVLQNSATEIFYAYKQMNVRSDTLSTSIPFVDDDTTVTQDVSPLFLWDDRQQTLLRRTDINNLHDTHWTTHWWSWSTLILLTKHYGLPVTFQAQLARTAYARQGIRDQIISDKDIISHIER